MLRSITARVAFALVLSVAACGDDQRGLKSVDEAFGPGLSGPQTPGNTSGEVPTGSDFEIAGAGCRVTSTSVVLLVANENAIPVQYTGCRARWTESSRVLTWQMTTTGTTGSIESPGNGSINLSVHQDSKENTSFPIARTASVLPASVSVDEVVFAMTVDGRRYSARGTIRLGTNLVNSKGASASIDITFDGVSLVGASGTSGTGDPGGTSGPTGLSGSISLVASAAAAERDSGR